MGQHDDIGLCIESWSRRVGKGVYRRTRWRIRVLARTRAHIRASPMPVIASVFAVFIPLLRLKSIHGSTE